MNAPIRRKSYADSDVADPTIILGKDAALFIETWAERKARRAVEKEDVKIAKQPLSKFRGYRLTPEIKTEFRSMWNQGCQIKLIKDRFKISKQTVIAWRKALGLRARMERPEEKRDLKLWVWVNASEHSALQQRAMEKGLAVSAYMRSLVRRDLGL